MCQTVCPHLHGAARRKQKDTRRTRTSCSFICTLFLRPFLNYLGSSCCRRRVQNANKRHLQRRPRRLCKADRGKNWFAFKVGDIQFPSWGSIYKKKPVAKKFRFINHRSEISLRGGFDTELWEFGQQDNYEKRQINWQKSLIKPTQWIMREGNKFQTKSFYL
jgi:hypothetical protein